MRRARPSWCGSRERAAGRLLLVATCRPEYDRAPFSEVGPVDVRLSAFTAMETVELLDHLLGQAPELDRLRTQLAEMCRGNALFLEETVRALADSGRLAGSLGQYRLQGAVGEIAIPADITRSSKRVSNGWTRTRSGSPRSPRSSVVNSWSPAAQAWLAARPAL